MKALRLRDNFYLELKDEVKDTKGIIYTFKELMLVPEDGEEVHYTLSKNDKIELRQRYAGLAMQGMLANSFGEDVLSPDNVAKMSIKYADALIKELDKVSI